MELEGRKELVDTGKSSRTWSVPTVSFRLAVLNVFQGFFGPKMAVFGPKLQFLKPRSVTCESRSRPPPLTFLLKLRVIVLHTHRYYPPKFHPHLKHHDGSLIFSHFARAAACLLLAAAKPGRSTLDAKKGYKTKTGSTSSVTLTLTLTRGATATTTCPQWKCGGDAAHSGSDRGRPQFPPSPTGGEGGGAGPRPVADPGGAWSDGGPRGDRLTRGRVQGRAAWPRPVAGLGWRGEAAGGDQQQPPTDRRVLQGAG